MPVESVGELGSWTGHRVRVVSAALCRFSKRSSPGIRSGPPESKCHLHSSSARTLAEIVLAFEEVLSKEGQFNVSVDVDRDLPGGLDVRGAGPIRRAARSVRVSEAELGQTNAGEK